MKTICKEEWRWTGHTITRKRILTTVLEGRKEEEKNIKLDKVVKRR